LILACISTGAVNSKKHVLLGMRSGAWMHHYVRPLVRERHIRVPLLHGWTAMFAVMAQRARKAVRLTYQ
jgi:hypothetical protein